MHSPTKSSNNLKLAYIDWINQNKSQKLFDQSLNQRNLDKKVDYKEENLAKVLNTYTKVFRIIFFQAIVK